MAGTPLAPSGPGHQSADRSDVSYDVLVLDAAFKQSLAAIRSLGRAGLRVAAAECFAECDPRQPVAGFRSRYSAHNQVLPSYVLDTGAYTEAILDFVRQHPTRVVLPTMDGSIASLRTIRSQLADLGCVVALASDSALDVANDKDRTLQVADRLGIDCPRTLRIDDLCELPDLIKAFGFPFVLKPTVSWSAQSAVRLAPVEVVNQDELNEVASKFLTAGVGVLGQEWVSGRREAVTLFVLGQDILASCANATLRTTPALGGASVLRLSIPMPRDLFDSAVRLARAIGLDGVCEIEYRRDAAGRPVLMEINARLAGTIKNAIHSGVDLPLMVWRWAAAQHVGSIDSYRTGVRTRWLRGDFRWLRDNSSRVGRPDSMPRARALQAFALEFARSRHYDSVDGLDIGPVISEIQIMAAAVRKTREVDNNLHSAQTQGASHVN
jgi:predicted ATP-grasp superfamily ATP-dependent carboligase